MTSRLADLINTQIQFLPLENIDVSELNVRRREITADLDELAKNLDLFGLQQPILVAPKGERFAVVVGQRRYLAAKQLGWDQIPALVLSQPLDRVQATIFSLSANVQRRDLAARDKAEACSYLRQELGSNRAVADALGVTSQTVRKWLGFDAVPESVKELVRPGGLTVPQATRIAQHVDDEETAIEIARRIAGEPLKAERDRVLESVAELPGRSVATILRRASEKQQLREIHFVLTESSAQAIDAAARDQSTEANEIAMNATIEWLQDNRYLSST